jgi:hypothetical protein
MTPNGNHLRVRYEVFSPIQERFARGTKEMYGIRSKIFPGILATVSPGLYPYYQK